MWINTHDKGAFYKWQAGSTVILSRIAVKCLVTNVEQTYNKCKIGEETLNQKGIEMFERKKYILKQKNMHSFPFNYKNIKCG